MGGLNGQRIHEASYTNVNQFEEIRSISLVPSKSLSFVVDQLKGVAKSLEENGHPPCSLLYTDNPQGMNLHHQTVQVCLLIHIWYSPAEQKFHETITPSLAQGVEHLTPWSNLPAFTLQDVNTNCTSDPFTMDSICSDILEQVQLDSRLMVIAITIQLSSDRKVKAIQIRKGDGNIVFNVSPSLPLFMPGFASEP